MSETILRQWTMLRRIPRRPHKVTVRELAAHLDGEGFSVTRRQIQRDLVDLSAIFPLASDAPSKPAGWQWVGEQAFDLPGMDPPTALAFEMTRRFVEKQVPSAVLTTLQPHFRRAQAVLAEAADAGFATWPEKIRIVPRGFRLESPDIDEGVLQVVYDGLFKQRTIAIDYTSRGETNRKSSEISPLGLVVKEPVLYLVCVFWEYEDVRQIAVHRIHEARLLDGQSRVPADFDLDAYVSVGAFKYPILPRHKIDFVAIFSSESAIHLNECFIGLDQSIKPLADGRMQVKATVLDSLEFRWWLLGFGDNVEVAKPHQLRRWMAEVVARAGKFYQSNASS